MSARAEIRMPLEQEGDKSVVRAWLKQVGDKVMRDEPIVEIETDKVAIEVPAPADGVLAEIALHEGDEAPPGATLGVLVLSVSTVIPGRPQVEPGTQEIEGRIGRPWVPGLAARSRNDEKEQRLSPLVRRLLADNAIDVAAIAGSGRNGRITHKDVEAFLSSPVYGGSGRAAADGGEKASPLRRPSAATSPVNGGRKIIPHNSMRRNIAEHMTRSLATAPHVTAVFEADFSAISAHRQRHKAAYALAGAPLTYSAYIVRAAAEAMAAAPNVNSRWHDDELELFADCNIGIGVALGDKGLIVPVIAKAQTLSLQQIAQRLGELTEKARAGKLAPADVQGGTFTISNHGVSGSLLAAPIIINQPQSAILGVGKLEKRVVVREVDGADAIQIRPMAYVSLSIDHRVLDGHQTNAWLTRFVATLENWPCED